MLAETPPGANDSALLERGDFASMDSGMHAALAAGRNDLALEFASAAVDFAPVDASRRRTLATLLAGQGRLEEALPHFQVACDLAPQDAHLALANGVYNNEAKRPLQAVPNLIRALRLDPTLTEAYHHLAYAGLQLGQSSPASALALRAYWLDPDNASRALFAAHVLVQDGRPAEATGFLEDVLHRFPGDAAVLRTLSHQSAADGRLERALEHIEAALALRPDDSEYHLHRSSLLYSMGEVRAAAAAMDGALALDAVDLGVLRHAVTIYLEAGHIDKAVSTSAELLRRAPDHEEYASCMAHVLSQKLTAPAALPDILTRKRAAPPRAPRAPATFATAFRTQCRVIGALVLREMRTRFGESRLGYLWVLMEMVIHLGVLAIVFQFTMHGAPPIGDSFFFFYFTGLTPYLLFTHTSDHMSHAIVQNRPMLQLPMVTNIDVMAARGLLELATMALIFLLFTVGFMIAGVDAFPKDPGAALFAFLAAWLLGLGFGVINACLTVFFSMWHHVFSIVLRALYFSSGIFYVPGAMPQAVREGLAWNPLLHCVDWFRTAFFRSYEPAWLDRGYPVAFALVVIAIGLMVEAAFRRSLKRAQ